MTTDEECRTNSAVTSVTWALGDAEGVDHLQDAWYQVDRLRSSDILSLTQTNTTA